jgi:hypothetical protein
MESDLKKISNPRMSNPDGMYASEARLEDCVTLRDYAHVHFMSAIISNADTMREITKTYNSSQKDKRIDFEELVAKISFSYADAMLKIRSENN